MPQWLSMFPHRNVTSDGDDEKRHGQSSSRSNDDAEKETRASNGTTMPTSSTSTAVENLVLPLPVTQPISTLTSDRRIRQHQKFGWKVYWTRFKRRIGTGTEPSSSSVVGESAAESAYARRLAEHQIEGPWGDDHIVDEVVVDRAWTEGIQTSTTPYSECGITPEKTPSQQHDQRSNDGTSVVTNGWGRVRKTLAIIRWHTWPFLMEIFSSRFPDEKTERHYAQENWFLKKSLALWASLWLIVNWVLGCLFVPNYQFYLLDKIFYFVVAPLLSIPIVFMVMYDWPRDRPYLYQAILVLAVWCWPFYQIVFMLVCGYFGPTPHCGGRDFLPTFHYTSALQTIGLFGLMLNRFPAAIGALSFFLFTSITMIPLSRGWGRLLINFFVFQTILIYLHYMRESSERRLYTLRDQLKIQYKATQKAQINERKAAESKRRLTSYVRVPLNTALLAVQNMEASGAILKDQEIEFSALGGSLSMMSKVLNDVLDFNRMDSGKFEFASRRYAFHQVMQSLFVPLRMATDARELTLVADLDRNIDIIARKVAYEGLGENKETIRDHIRNYPDVDGMVVGDETRLRQIITNLASNACKFTPSGGKLIITTRLILPDVPEGTDPLDIETAKIPRIEKPAIHPISQNHNEESPYRATFHRSRDFAQDDDPVHGRAFEGEDDGVEQPLSTDRLTEHNKRHATSPLEYIIVRIEVTDTGCGIKPEDMVQSKLFSAFNQTEQGRQQGGKGTGLGLALVRQIVKLSGGRLGVRSKIGEGSTFWVELPLRVGVDSGHTVNQHTPEIYQHSVVNRESTGRTGEEHLASDRRMSEAAMQGIMEQKGLFEITLRKPGCGTTLRSSAKLLADPMAQAALELSQAQIASTSAQCPLPSPTRFSLKLGERSQSPQSFVDSHADSPESSQSVNALCPAVLPNSDAISPTKDVMVMPPEDGSSKLKKFDHSFTRGSPTTSFTALSIEPGLPVLVVDDDLITRMLMKRILTRLGCQVTCAENGEMALEMILGCAPPLETAVASTVVRTLPEPPPPPPPQAEQTFCEEGKFAVVFLDNQMPIMSGLKVVENLRKLNRHDFVVGVTGNALLSDQNEYYAAGVDRILTKPVLERHLREILIEADERHKSRVALEVCTPGILPPS